MSYGTARRTYHKARIGGTLSLRDRPGVVVVDFCRGFTDPSCSVGSDLSAQIESTRHLLDRARERALPVLFTTIAFDPHLKDAGGVWLQKMPALGELVVGSPWVEIDPRLGRTPDEPVLVKKAASAFFGTNLQAMLVGQGVDTVVLCGATTSGCIRATAVDLCQHGFPSLVPRECVGDRASAPHEANLFDIDAKYADVVPLETALEYLGAAGSTSRGER